MVDKIIKNVEVEHPLDEVFDIEPGQTIIEYEEKLPSVIVKHEEYDDKDAEVEEQFQEVYDKAMDAFEDQTRNAEDIAGQYLARNTEVAAQLLETALKAAKEKANLKKHKDNISIKKEDAGAPTTVNNNLIMDRNEILKMLQGNSEDDTDANEE